MNQPSLTCCAAMNRHSTFDCKVHTDKYECPDVLIDFQPKKKYFTLLIHDGGTSGITIKFCPWCGSQLSKPQQ